MEARTARTRECWKCGKRGHFSKECWGKKNTNKGDSRPNVEPEVEIVGFNMFYLDAPTEEVRKKARNKIRVGKDGMASENHVREDDSW